MVVKGRGRLAKPGVNLLEIEVVNTWMNRLVGDEQSGVNRKATSATAKQWNSHSPLQPAGLIGPVKLQIGSGGKD